MQTKIQIKRILIILMLTQLVLICHGVYFLSHGYVAIGLFNIIFNSVFFVMNIVTLRNVLNH
jgi:hypothetical protein